MNSIGIDPGSRNLGVAVTDENGKVVHTSLLDPKLNGFRGCINDVINIGLFYDVEKVCIERFVAYENIMSKATEDILMLIGGLKYGFMADVDLIPKMFRAIEWKPALCKYLVKKFKFSNPSNSFDKKYSIAAAACIIGEKPKTDHEADAICLSYMWNVK